MTVLSNLHILNWFRGTIVCAKLCNGKGLQEKNYTARITFELLSFPSMAWGKEVYVNLDTWLAK